MKSRRVLILIFGVSLGILWADVVTPRFHSGPHDELVVSPLIVAGWVVGWIVIAGFISLLLKLLKKK